MVAADPPSRSKEKLNQEYNTVCEPPDGSFLSSSIKYKTGLFNPSPKLPSKAFIQSDFISVHHDLDEHGSLWKLLLLLRQLQQLRLLHLWRKLSLLVMDEDGLPEQS
jgi:hypothetical protein